MLSLRYSALSKDDLNEIVRFIAKDKPFAARPWVEKIRAKCRLAAKPPGIGDDRSDLGDGIRSTYVGSYIIFFREKDGTLEIVAFDAATMSFHSFSRCS